MMDATPGTAAWHAIYGTSAADVTGADEEVTRLARRVVELEAALRDLVVFSGAYLSEMDDPEPSPDARPVLEASREYARRILGLA